MNTKNYNTTQLDPDIAAERNVIHRDMIAHALRWTYVLHEAKRFERVCDFGCGTGNLLEVLYRNRYQAERYVGLDVREKTIDQNRSKYHTVPWAEFYPADLTKTDFDYSSIQADRVCSFEVLEHVGKQNGPAFIRNFKACGNPNASYYLSTPCYDDKVGAAENHTYDSGDGRGKAVQEYTYEETKQLLETEFVIVKNFGTFASQRDYTPFMDEAQLDLLNKLKEYYDSNLISNIFAPLFPEHSRNVIWKLKAR